MSNLPLADAKLKNSALPKRLCNISFITEIPREGLLFSSIENQLLISSFTSDESLSYVAEASLEVPSEILTIQYPGKESIDTRMAKILDFRPKLFITSENQYLNDLSFQNIWDLLFSIFTSSNSSSRLLELVAYEFYRIAFMIDYKRIPSGTPFQVTSLQTNSTSVFKSSFDFYMYTPTPWVMSEIKSYLPNIAGVSWEAFFTYNDLLALNEDCKYHYIKLTQMLNTGHSYEESYSEATKHIKKGVGRTNTLLTHIHLLAVILNESSLTRLLQSFVRGRGVAPMTLRDLNAFLSNYLNTLNNQ